MYSVTKFEDRYMTAFSVPPSAHSDLPEDFAELSRIHFYLGNHPIDHMIKSVEDASLEQIDKGRVQIYFATKEIQEFLSGSWSNVSAFSKDSLNPELYFQKTFNHTFKHTLEVLENAYKKPTKKNNLEIIETMMGLTHEAQFLSKELEKVGVITDTKKIEEIQNLYEKVFNLKQNYPNLAPLKAFNDYEDNAKMSVIEQLKTPYNFNFSEMSKHIYTDMGDWMPTLRYLLDEREKIDQPGYSFHQENTQELKEHFLKQIKSFNSLLKNGVVNYVHSYEAAISHEVFINIQKSLVSAESYFERAKNYHEKKLTSYYFDKNYHKEELEKLNAIKEDFIQQKIDDKAFYEKYLTLLYRQEKNISSTLDKVKANLFNINLKDTVTFTGDITTGFVIGQFSNADKVLVVHKDIFVTVPEAIYATVLDKKTYEDLVKNNNLVFNEEFRNSEFSNSSNFWSYGQFLQEISDSSVQHFFLGKDFDLIDNTTLDLQDTKKKPKM